MRPLTACLSFDELQGSSEELVRDDGALGDLRVVFAERVSGSSLPA